MKSKTTGITFGLLFILFGSYLLVRDFFYFRIDEEMIGAVICGIGALFFYSKWIANRSHVWGLVLGSVCLFIGYVLFVEFFFWYGNDSIPVALFLIAGTTFLAAYLRTRSEWGLIIPAGACYTLAGVVFAETFDHYSHDANGGFVLFLGMAATFGILHFMNNEERNLSWAKYPALGCIALAVIIGIEASAWYIEDFVVPGLFIAVGVIILLKSALFKKNGNNNQLQVQ